MDLTREEHQELVLMVGSRKEWATYLGLTPEEAQSIWTDLKLLVPTAYVKSLSRRQLQSVVAYCRGVRQAAKHMGVSQGFLINHLRVGVKYSKPDDLDWNEDQCRDAFTKYRSVRFVARMNGVTENQVRKEVASLGIEVATLIDYSTGDHSNAKGRRAELDYAEMRGDMILDDKNRSEGSQAKWDFDDLKYGKVNVKSACRQKYKAKTRIDDPYFWKWSTRGADECEFFAILCYDEGMQTLIGYTIISTRDRTFKKSEILQTGDFFRGLNGISTGKES